MKRYEMIKKHTDFTNIINNGKKNSGKYMIIFMTKKDFEKPNYGIAVSKKCGNSVTRNKLKRKFRSLIDNNRLVFKNNHNYIIMIKKEANNASFKELTEELNRLLRKE